MKKNLVAIALLVVTTITSVGIPAVFASPETLELATVRSCSKHDSDLSFLRELGVLDEGVKYDCCKTKLYPELVLRALCAMYCEEGCEGHQPMEGTEKYRVTFGRFSTYFWQFNNSILYADKRFAADYLAFDYLKPYKVVSSSKQSVSQITIGDLNEMLRKVSEKPNEVWTFDAPALVEKYRIQIDANYMPGKFFYYFNMLPENLLNDFENTTWTIRYGISWFKDTSYTPETAGGVCHYHKKFLGIYNPSAIIHEMGHFMHWYHGTYYKLDHLFLESSNEGVKEVIGSYALTNQREWCAEAFEYFIRNKDNEAALKAFERVAPVTYEYFSTKAKRGWTR